VRDPPSVSNQMDAFLDVLWRSSGSDLIITAGWPPQIRVQGELVSVPGHPAPSSHDTDAMLDGLMTLSRHRAGT
jgi:twitching motility protein PilT